MFHFPAFPPHTLCIQVRVTGHDSSQVSPFGHPRINARLPTPQGLSQAPTSFIGSRCQGIHHAPSVACHNNTTTNTNNHTRQNQCSHRQTKHMHYKQSTHPQEDTHHQQNQQQASPDQRGMQTHHDTPQDHPTPNNRARHLAACQKMHRVHCAVLKQQPGPPAPHHHQHGSRHLAQDRATTPRVIPQDPTVCPHPTADSPEPTNQGGHRPTTRRTGPADLRYQSMFHIRTHSLNTPTPNGRAPTVRAP